MEAFGIPRRLFGHIVLVTHRAGIPWNYIRHHSNDTGYSCVGRLELENVWQMKSFSTKIEE